MGYEKYDDAARAAKKIGSFITIIVIGAIVLVSALLYYFIDARYSDFFPRCPFYSLTGLYCPGCGSQRAISSLLHGEVVQALRYNTFLVVALPIILLSFCLNGSNALLLKKSGEGSNFGRFVKTLLVAAVLYAVVRNIPIYPFTLLAP